MRRREREQWMQLVTDEREAHRKERQELLNRLAKPDVRIVDAPPEPREPVVQRDMAELAFIGREVPDGVSVGSVRDNEHTG